MQMVSWGCCCRCKDCKFYKTDVTQEQALRFFVPYDFFLHNSDKLDGTQEPITRSERAYVCVCEREHTIWFFTIL